MFVLFARVRLGTGPLGYGRLLAVAAGGGLLGGLAAITTVIATTWHAVGTVPHAPHHSGAQRAHQLGPALPLPASPARRWD